MNNDFFYQSQNDTENSNTGANKNQQPYIPLSYEEALEQRAHYKTIETIPDYSYPRLERAASVIRLISYIFAGIFMVCFILGKATGGAVFFYEKTEGIVTDCDKVYYGSLLNRHAEYKVTVAYKYNNEDCSRQFMSSIPRYKEQKFDVYVNTRNSYVMCFDSRVGVLPLISPIILFIIGLWGLSFVLANYGRFRLNIALGMGPRFKF